MESRPNPDLLLKQIEAQASTRGRLKIFFGAVAGVGKTYAMLQEALIRKREGTCVAVGVVETHRRSETEALLGGLDSIPLRTVPYKSIEVTEFDLEAALRIHPTLILVDELAHTNAPGSRHAKRWQDVEELLNAGINVHTTLNVQHCESMNDLVAQATHVIVRETVPDAITDKADEIALVDIPPEALLKRLKEGKVYLGEQAERAAQNFFRLGNLIALRQLALKYTSRSVDSKLRAYQALQSVSSVWKIGEHFLVCVSSNPGAIKIIRAAKQIAADLGAQWTVACVESVSRPLNAQNKENLKAMFLSAEQMGAKTVILYGENAAETIVAYAHSKNMSRIIIGKPGKPRFREVLFGSFVDKLSRICGAIDLFLISGEEEPQNAPSEEFMQPAEQDPQDFICR